MSRPQPASGHPLGARMEISCSDPWKCSRGIDQVVNELYALDTAAGEGWMRNSSSWGAHGIRLLALTAVVLFGLLLLGATSARPAQHAHVTVTFLTYVTNEPAYSAVIKNFERTHPNVKIEVTSTQTVATLYQVETTELAAGNA